MSRIWTRLWAALALLCLCGLAACATTPSGKLGVPKETEPVGGHRVSGAAPGALPSAARRGGGLKVALLLPLSGNYRDVGQAMMNAASVALFDLGDERIDIMPQDTKGTPAGAAAAATAAVKSGAQVILGPLLSGSIRAVTPIARKQDLKIIGFSTDRTVAGNGVYLLSFLPDEEVRRIISYAHSRGYGKFAAMIPQTPYGDTVLKSLDATLKETGGALVATQSYQPDSSKLYAPVRKLTEYDARRHELIRERAYLSSFGKDDFAEDILTSLEKRETLGSVDFDAVLVPEGAALLKAMAPLFAYYEINTAKVKMLGTGLWNDTSLLREPQLEGGWFAAPDPTRATAFFARYRKLFNHSAPRISTLAYDSVALVASLSHDGDKTDFSDKTMTARNGFTGIDGIFRFRPDGTAERGLAVLEIQPSGFKIVDPAPTSFLGFEDLMSGRKVKAAPKKQTKSAQ